MLFQLWKFRMITAEATKDCTGEAVWQLLYADDVVLFAESREEVKQKFLECKLALETRDGKMFLCRTKFMVTGKKSEVIRSS